ncbi:MAG: hypothetical protein H7098_09450 [Oligoflexus sp.]|nr:hypothetical protein [Pseudopedobacter sp.]
MKKGTYKIYESAEELEIARLKQAANTTYTERFYTLTKLIRISKMINNAKIASSSNNNKT